MIRYRTYPGASWSEDLPYDMYWASYIIGRYEYQIKGRDY